MRHPRPVKTLVAVTGLLLLLLAVLGASPTVPPGLRVAGAPETVFAWSRDRCAPDDIPDAPARAFRDAAGMIHLVASHHVNRALVGPDLDRVRPTCRPILASVGDGDPATYADRTWLAAFFTRDGRRVLGLGHMEYQGHRHPGRCAGRDYRACWRNAIVAFRSEDGGHGFLPAAPSGRHVVAALPYRYGGDEGRPTGYFGPSNILEHAGRLHVFIFAEAMGVQRRGACLLRAEDPDGDGPPVWRAFDGRDFTVAFADPYRMAVDDPARHACAPLSGIGSTIASVVRHAPSGLFVALIAARRAPAPDAPPVSGIWYLVSRDLLAWSAPRLLFAGPLLFARDCARDDAFAYPSLLDPASPSRNFDVVGGRAFLYLVRIRLADCRPTMTRDLVRLPVELTLTADGRPRPDRDPPPAGAGGRAGVAGGGRGRSRAGRAGGRPCGAWSPTPGRRAGGRCTGRSPPDRADRRAAPRLRPP